jgi:hypothetical protein
MNARPTTQVTYTGVTAVIDCDPIAVPTANGTRIVRELLIQHAGGITRIVCESMPLAQEPAHGA